MTKRPSETMNNDARMVVGTEKHKPYPSYKDSGVEGLREVPRHWAVRKVTQLFSIGSGTTPPTDYSEYYGGKIPWITTSELRESVVTSTEQTVTKQALETFPALNVYPEGSVAVAMYGATIGRLGVLGTSAAVNQACCVFSVPRRIDAWFWFYWLQSRRPYLISLGYGGGQPNLSQELLKSIRVPTPPLNEQRAIAAFLDRETAKIDAPVAKKERLIELLQEKRTALITRAVTKGLDPDVPMKDSGVEWLGAVPANWDLLVLKRRWNVIDCKHLTVPFIGEGIHLASVRETQSFELDLKDAQRTTVEWYKTLIDGERKPRRGDLIYCRNVSVGSASVVTGDDLFAMGQDVCLIRSSTENQRWLNYFLCSSAMSYQLALRLVGSTFNRINVAEVMTLLIPVSPRVEQDRIAQFLDLETAKIDSLVAKVYEAINHLKELRTALISAAVTGKIDVRDGAAQTPGIAS